MKLATSSKKTKKVARGKGGGSSSPNSDSRIDQLSNLMADVTKRHGDGALMLMGESPTKDVRVTSSGSLAIDTALGVGGYPRGRVVEIFGPESSGKTTLTLHAIAECQKSGGVAAFIDAEHAMDLDYAKQLGIDTDALLFSQPDYGEQALNIVEEIVKANLVDLVVVDSVAALTPKAELDANMEQNHVGLQARMMSQAMRKLTAVTHKTSTCLMFINQTRQKIGVMYGSPETTPGGNALKFYCSVRINIRKISSIKEGEKVVGNNVRVKVVKNKLAPPFREALTSIIFGKGIDRAGEIVDMAVSSGLIEKSGAWFKYEGKSIGQGKNGVIKYFEDNPDFYKEIENIIRGTE